MADTQTQIDAALTQQAQLITGVAKTVTDAVAEIQAGNTEIAQAIQELQAGGQPNLQGILDRINANNTALSSIQTALPALTPLPTATPAAPSGPAPSDGGTPTAPQAG